MAIALGEVAAINPPVSRKPSGGEKVSFIPMSDVGTDGSISEHEARIWSEVSTGYTQFERGDLLVAKITPCFENGKIAYATTSTEVAAGSTEFHVIRVDSRRLDPRYTFHFLRAPTVRVAGERRMTGSAGQRRLPETFLRELAIPLPPVEEQRRIAAILDAADELRRKRRQSLALLDSLTESIFLDMFGDALDGSSLWPIGRVSDAVAKFEAGRSIETKGVDPMGSRYRVLKVSCLTSGRYLPDESKAVAASYEPPPGHLVRSGDLLFSRANTASLVGAVGLVNAAPNGELLSDKIWRFAWRQPMIVRPRFVEAFFKRPRVRSLISSLATGTSGSMKNISQAKVMGLPLSVPPVALQEEFERRLDEADRACRAAQESLALMHQAFDSLQYRAFRGEL